MRNFLTCLCLLAAPATLRADALIHNDCLGNSYETCFVLIEGEITPGLTDRLQALADSGGIDGGVVYLNSPGGSLGEGLKLGRYIRSKGWDTSIGSSDGVPRWPDGTVRAMGSGGLGPGHCESACSYAFMGGERRFYQDNDKLGLHQFYAPGEEIGGEVAQKFSGQIVSYMVEMGVDARIFAFAAGQVSTGMYYVPRGEAEQYDLVSRSGFDDLYMEPYDVGMVAISERLDPPQPYDGIDQVSFYCRGGQAYALMHAAIHNFTEGDSGVASVWIGASKYDLPADALSLRIDGSEAFLLFRLPADVTLAMSQGTGFSIWASYGRVTGGNYIATRDTTALDRQMLAAAFRFCVG